MNKMNQRGAVSILSVIIFTTIITVLITAYLKSAINQQAEAISYDFSTRAYYAAESGVQDTVNVLRGDPSKQTDKAGCNPYNSDASGYKSLDDDLSIGYTCQRLEFQPSSLTGFVQQNTQAALIKIDPPGGVSNPKLVVRWYKQTPIGSSRPVLVPRTYDAPYLAASDQWKNGSNFIHTMMRVEVINSLKTGITDSNTSQRVTFLNPTSSTAPYVSNLVDFTTANNNNQSTQQTNLFANAKCFPSNNVTGSDMSDGEATYSCKKEIDLAGYDFSTHDVYVRLSGVYNPGMQTDFSLQLLDGSSVVNLANSQVSVDITARAGDRTYRRIVQRIPLPNYKILTGPDASVIAAEGVCKLFSVGTQASLFTQPGCNPITDN